MNDELDTLRAPVPVGVAASPTATPGSALHPAIDARSIVAVPRPTNVRQLDRPAPLRPPDPLGILDPDEPSARVLTASRPRPARRPWLAVVTAATVAACAVGLVVYVGRDDGPSGDGDLVAGASVPADDAQRHGSLDAALLGT